MERWHEGNLIAGRYRLSPRLASGAPVSKTDARVEAYGAVDELNAVIGIARLNSGQNDRIDAMLGRSRSVELDLDETLDGVTVTAGSRIYDSGRFAGSPHGRELIGYVPWQFSLPDAGKGFEAAWQKLLAPDGFAAPFGPTTVERNDPMFLLKKTCCWWSGQSWPYATTQTLKALANVLHVGHDNPGVTRADYLKLLTIYAKSHRKNGKPYLAEALHPDTGSFEGHDGYNHGEPVENVGADALVDRIDAIELGAFGAGRGTAAGH